MALIHQSQIGDISYSKFDGLLLSEKQKFNSTSGMTDFYFTILPDSVKVVETEIEINGIPYDEKTASNPYGAYSREGLHFKWEFTQANGGFDLDETSVVVIHIHFYANEGQKLPTSVKIVPLNADSPSDIVGDYETDQNTYFEQYDIKNANIEDFLGLNINGALYSHPNIISYNANTGMITINKLKLEETDAVNVIANIN